MKLSSELTEKATTVSQLLEKVQELDAPIDVRMLGALTAITVLTAGLGERLDRIIELLEEQKGKQR